VHLGGQKTHEVTRACGSFTEKFARQNGRKSARFDENSYH